MFHGHPCSREMRSRLQSMHLTSSTATVLYRTGKIVRARCRILHGPRHKADGLPHWGHCIVLHPRRRGPILLVISIQHGLHGIVRLVCIALDVLLSMNRTTPDCIPYTLAVLVGMLLKVR